MSDIIISHEDGILSLRLNRSAKKNALTGAMYTALADGLMQAARDEAVRAVVISAEGSDFCAGNDILDFAQNLAQFQPGGALVEDIPVFRFLKAITFFEKPLIAAVQGQAVGVGVTLLLHCDLVVVADDIRLSLPFLKLGLVPEAGSTLLLPQRIGHARAFGWMALGEIVGAEEARQMGLANRVVTRQELTHTAMALAADLARLSPSSLRHTKAFMRDPETLWQVIEAEGEVFRQQLQSPEAMAAFTAFMNRAL